MGHERDVGRNGRVGLNTMNHISLYGTLARLLGPGDDRARAAESPATIQGTVEVRLHDAAALREAARDRGLDYGELDKPAKLDLARGVEPTEVRRTPNSTLVEYHEHLADLVDPATVAPAEHAEYLAVGTDDTPASPSDTGLVNEVDRVAVTESSRTGRDFFASTFLDTAEGSGFTLREVLLSSGAVAGDGIDFNRAVISDLVKTTDDTATIDVTLQYRA